MLVMEWLTAGVKSEHFVVFGFGKQRINTQREQSRLIPVVYKVYLLCGKGAPVAPEEVNSARPCVATWNCAGVFKIPQAELGRPSCPGPRRLCAVCR